MSVYLFYNYIWIGLFILGLIAIVLGINNIFYHNIKNKVNKNVKIDVSIPLIFIIVFISFIFSSINLLKNYYIFSLNNLFNSIIFILMNALFLTYIILLLSFLNNKIIKNNNKINKNINKTAIIILGILFIFFS